jgi:hypothetical protein
MNLLGKIGKYCIYATFAFGSLVFPIHKELSPMIQEATNNPTESVLEFKARRYAQLQISEDAEFIDTKKPNMLYVVPIADHNGAFENNYSLWFYKQLQNVYDTKAIIIQSESELYQTLSQIPDIELLVLSGHGSSTTMQFGTSPLLERIIESTEDLNVEDLSQEEYEAIDSLMLDTRDNEIYSFLQNISSDAIIF